MDQIIILLPGRQEPSPAVARLLAVVDDLIAEGERHRAARDPENVLRCAMDAARWMRVVDTFQKMERPCG